MTGRKRAAKPSQTEVKAAFRCHALMGAYLRFLEGAPDNAPPCAACAVREKELFGFMLTPENAGGRYPTPDQPEPVAWEPSLESLGARLGTTRRKCLNCGWLEGALAYEAAETQATSETGTHFADTRPAASEQIAAWLVDRNPDLQAVGDFARVVSDYTEPDWSGLLIDGKSVSVAVDGLKSDENSRWSGKLVVRDRKSLRKRPDISWRTISDRIPKWVRWRRLEQATGLTIERPYSVE